MSEGKRWCFTINNPTPEDKQDVNRLATICDYLVAQTERGEEGTLHIQGFFILKTKKRMSWLKNNFNSRAHLEISRGTNQQAADYCKKEETRAQGGWRSLVGCSPWGR